jgi:hypothetical protein
MNKETQKQIMKTVALWDLFDESLASIDDRALRHRMKFLFKGLSNKSYLFRKELERNGVINNQEDDYERVKDYIAETINEQFESIK